MCCVCMCVCLFVSVYPPLSFPHTGVFQQRREDEPPEQVRWDPKNPLGYLFSGVVGVIPSDLMRKRGNTNDFLQCQNLLIRRGITLSVNVCVFPVSHKRLLARCLLFVRGVFCLDVISASLFPLPCMRRRRCGLLSKGPFGQKTIVVGVERKKKKDVTDWSNVPFFPRELVHRANRKKQNKKTNISTRTQM